MLWVGERASSELSFRGWSERKSIFIHCEKRKEGKNVQREWATECDCGLLSDDKATVYKFSFTWHCRQTLTRAWMYKENRQFNVSSDAINFQQIFSWSHNNLCKFFLLVHECELQNLKSHEGENMKLHLINHCRRWDLRRAIFSMHAREEEERFQFKVYWLNSFLIHPFNSLKMIRFSSS